MGLATVPNILTRKAISKVQLSHTAKSTSAVFHDPNLVRSAGLVLVMTLAARAGLTDLADRFWAKDWIETRHDLRATTRARLETTMRMQVLPKFGKLPLIKISKISITAEVAAK